MAFLGQSFNLNDLPESTGGEFYALPSGEYIASITKAGVKQTQAGGEMITLQFSIIGPTHQGRVIFHNLNIRNASEKAEQMALRSLREIMTAIGLQEIDDTDVFVGRTLKIKVTKKKEANEKYADPNGERNDITAFSSAGGSEAPKPPASQAPKPPSPPARQAQASDVPPWAR